MLPSDPRTWSDFKNPEQHGFEKIDCDTTLERALFAWGASLAMFAVLILWEVFVHQPLRRRSIFIPPAAVPLLVPGLIAGALVLLALRLLTDNFYLVDASRRLVFYHFWFLFIRRVSLLLERKDIVEVTTDSRQRSSGYRSWSNQYWWEHRVVVIDTQGRLLPMTNWQRDALWASNNYAAELAKKLDCPCHEMPENSRLSVRAEGDKASATFAAPTWWTTQGGPRWAGAVAGLVFLGIVYVIARLL